MIRQLAQCPYCKSTEIALDDAPELLINPDSAEHEPCVHLIWVDGRYSQWEPRPHGPGHMIGSTEFRWDHSEFAMIDEYEDWIKYFLELANQGKEWEFAPPGAFDIKALSAEQKAKTAEGKDYTAAEVDGWAIFAQDAAAFLTAVPACVEKHAEALDPGEGDK